MNYISTRNSSLILNSCEAIYRGIAPDGGLFVPEYIPKFEMSPEELLDKDYRSLTAYILNLYFPDLGYETICECVTKGYEGKFDVPECVELKHFDRFSYLELYHGPTSAFKDMALCLLPRLLTSAGKKLGKNEQTVILTATSGDTGKAALEGFADVKGTQIIVFYPENGVSEVQKAQMQTQSGNNVHVFGVNGNFDDAQTGVKKALKNLHADGINFSSANSINIGRLVPQICYYFYSYAQMVKNGKIAYGDKLNFSVPTGNFGDILAGWFAEKMGLPVGKLLCASNKNNILSDFIRTGIYDSRREFYTTASPSMDILISSNLERLIFFASGCNSDYVVKLMEKLSSEKHFEVNEEVLGNIRKDFECGWTSEEECLEEINTVWRNNGYLIDPHTAVASYRAKKTFDNPTVILSTANPYKFPSSILSALQNEPSEDNGFEAMKKLNELTQVAVPKHLDELKNRKCRFMEVVNPDEISKTVMETVRSDNEK